jgi:predicted transcriptional regulator YdeE
MNNLKIEPFKVIGISVRTTNENNQVAIDIVALWDKFLNENVLSAIPNKIDNTVFSIYTDYESDHTKPYTTFLGCKVKNLDSVPDGMIGKSFDGGDYVKFTVKGNLMDGLVAKKWSKIWGMDLPRVYTADFEVYGEKAQNPANAEVDIFIAVN